MTAREVRVATVFVLGIGVAVAAGPALMAQAPQVAAQIIQADQEDEFVKGTVSAKAAGVTAPQVRRQTHPKYTPATLKEKIQGLVKLEVVVGVDGGVEKARVKEALHPELDAEALKTIDAWQFEPGRLDGAPARVLVEVVMEFRVH